MPIKYNTRWYLGTVTTLVLIIAGSITLPLDTRADSVITQGYNSSINLPAGAIVSIIKGSSNNVELASLVTADTMVGVVIDNNNAQVSLTSGSGQVQVATSGVNQVLVSDINGRIYSGEEIAASPINGVGMAATQNAEIIGAAEGNFPNATSTKQTVTTANGTKQVVDIGNIPVLVNVGYYAKQPNKTLVPTVIQNLANALAGKQVKTLPVLISMAIFLITLIVVVSIIYSLVHGSIISVGRNPMAQAAVYRNVIQLSALVVGLIAIAMFAIFMILTRFD